MNPHRFLLALFAVSPFLAHCTVDPTSPDPSNTQPAAAMTMEQPLDATTGDTAWGVVGQPMNVNISMTQTGPGTCTHYSIDGDSTVCSGPNTPLAFQLTSLACDDDLCDVTEIQVGTLKDGYGNRLLGDVVTIVPKSASVTLRATGTSSEFTESASLALSVESAK
jgi:hypothetical protein